MLLIVFLLIRFYSWFGLTDAADASRVGFLITGVWWLLFALPAFKYLNEETLPDEIKPSTPG